MEKYCIIPEKGNVFWQMVKGLEMSRAEKDMFRACVIKHVEISLKENSWEMLLETRQLIGQELLGRAGEYICKKCNITGVRFYQDVTAFEESVEAVWNELVAQVSNGKPMLRLLLSNAEKEVDGIHVTVKVRGGLAGELLRAHAVPQLMQKAMEEKLGFGCQVEFNAVDEEGDVLPQITDREAFMTPEYRQAMRAAQEKKPERASAASKTSASAGKPQEKKVVIPDGSTTLLFGKGVSGDAVPISELDGEARNIVLSGYIAGVKGFEFAKTNLITFNLADDSDGITCKTFIKEKEEYEALLGSLKDGMLLKIFGSVQFDKFSNDFTMMARSAYKLTPKVREDNAEVKRVELHAHTHMSNMDAVVSVKDLIKTAARWGWDSIAVTDHGVVQAFPDAMNTLEYGKLDIKVIYGMEGYLVGEDYEQKRANHIILLAKNPRGLRNLYHMVSISHLRYFHRQPRLPRWLIEEYRDGIIVGSACEAGELIRAIVADQPDEDLVRIAEFYDYLEIQPIGNNEFLVRSEEFPHIQNDEDLKKINLKVAELAKRLNKPLVATCDVHFLNPEDSIYRAILMKGKGFDDAELQPPLYLRTTEEMLREFEYLGEELAYEAVITNPRMISDSVEKFKPIPDDLYSPMIPGADDEIRDMSYGKAKELYGENLPKIVTDRLTQELTPIINHGFSVLYLIAQRLVKKSMDDGYLVGSRGSVGSSFIATMTGITEVNPLPPHYRCPHCKYSEFVTDGSVGCGYDLPNKKCPVCGTPLVKDGHDIPFAVFLGFDGDKVPDIDLNFSGVYQPTAHKYTEVLFGKDNVYRAGTIATVADKTAYGYVKKFFEEKGIKKREAYIDRLARGCQGVKRTTGQHPAGIMVVPRDMDVHFFTPIQHPADDKTSATITTHFDYHSISSRLVKLDILGHDDPTVIKMLEDLTHRDPQTIPFDDPATLSIFSSTEALGVTPEELGANSGTFGIPEFRTSFTRQMIDDTHPACFSDLVRISGFSHGTDVWLGNAQELIRNGQCTLHDAISARDDIMMYLIHNGIEPLLAFKTMEKVRKGKGIADDVVEILRKGGIPEWYIEACQKIKYLFPRAHATAYVMMAYRIAFCKVHYPLAFYAAYFSIRADAFDADIIAQGKEYVHERIQEIEAKDKPEDKEKELLIVLQLAWEMYLRGYTMEYVDLYNSDATKFIIHEKSLLPPLTSLNGIGGSDANAIAEGRKDGDFSSIENMKKRTGASRTAIEALRRHGCLAGMDESDQMALFM